MPDDQDCQGNADCEAAQAQCQADYQSAEDKCQQVHDQHAADCARLPPAEQDQCLAQVEIDKKNCDATADTVKAFCFSEAARKFLNSSRNKGKKKRPGTNGCAPCTLPDCSQFVATCQAQLSALGGIIRQQRDTGTPDPDTTLHQIGGLIDQFLGR
jgi:hypothetical protein